MGIALLRDPSTVIWTGKVFLGRVDILIWVGRHFRSKKSLLITDCVYYAVNNVCHIYILCVRMQM